jgi:hypothetical protein
MVFVHYLERDVQMASHTNQQSKVNLFRLHGWQQLALYRLGLPPKH